MASTRRLHSRRLRYIINTILVYIMYDRFSIIISIYARILAVFFLENVLNIFVNCSFVSRFGKRHIHIFYFLTIYCWIYIVVVKKMIQLSLQTNNSNDITGGLVRKENFCRPTCFVVI